MRTAWVTLVVLAVFAASCSSDSKSTDCTPEAYFCEENTLRKCTADGTNSVLIKVCDEQCVAGECVSFSKPDGIGDASEDGLGGDIHPPDQADEFALPDPGTQETTVPDSGEPDEGAPDNVEPDLQPEVTPCEDECQEGEFFCSGIKVYHACQKGDDGCLHFDEAGVPCDDENPCTDDACALGKGCVTADNTEPCDDGNPCTQDDQCGEGKCAPGANVCQCDEDADCNLLDDQDMCNGVLLCKDNQCVVDPLTVVQCPDDPADPCVHYVCAPATGKCDLVPTQQAACDDKNLCTVGDYCDQGACVYASELICDDKNACTGDSCLPAQGCVFSPVNGAACADDGNPCTNDYCQAAECTHPSLLDNTDCGGGKVCKNGQCVTLDCNPACGQCQQCSNGLCVPGNENGACTDDGNSCTEDLCGGGSCKHPGKPDGSSCGAGMECQGGVCKQSSAPFELVGGLDHPWNLAIDDQNVYFVENKSAAGTVKKVSKTGGAVTTLASGLVEPTAIGVDAGWVYFIERNNGSNGSLKKVAVGGGGTTTLASNFKNAQNHLVVAGDSVYFGDGKSGGGGVIKKVGINGGETILVEGNGLLNLNTAIDVSGGSAYFRNDYDKILRVATTGGAVTELGSGSPSALKVWGSSIFFTEYSNGLIRQMPIGGGAASTLASGADSAANLAVDGSYVYWTEFNNPGKVARVPIGGGPTKTYSNQANAIGIAVDGQYVYYTVSVFTNQGKVMRAPK